MYVYYNPNPENKSVGDCVIRAISKLLGISWDTTYWLVVSQGFIVKDMPSSNDVWGSFLYAQGFRRKHLPDRCPNCYTVSDFCRDYPYGRFLLSTGSHTVAVINGDYYDAWDSGNEIPMHYWE